MIKYIICYKEQSIGTLYINEEGKYRYEANEKNIEKVEKEEEVCIYADLKKDRDWGAPISFFESRIYNCERFGMSDKIKYPNSDYCFIKDNHAK